METKTCPKCRVEKPLTGFSKNKMNKDGLQGWCKDCMSAKSKDYYAQNTEKHKKSVRRWVINNPEMRRASQAQGDGRRRSYEVSVRNDLTAAEWQEILDSQNHECFLCHRGFGKNLKPTRDHWIPVKSGGGLTKTNVVALCRSCNSRKGARLLSAEDVRNWNRGSEKP